MSIEEIRAINLHSAHPTQVNAIIKSVRNLSDTQSLEYITYFLNNVTDDDLKIPSYRMLVSAMKEILIFKAM
jgi:hypothetical protein